MRIENLVFGKNGFQDKLFFLVKDKLKQTLLRWINYPVFPNAGVEVLGALLHVITAAIPSGLSVKPSQLGSGLDEDRARARLTRIAEAAAEAVTSAVAVDVCPGVSVPLGDGVTARYRGLRLEVRDAADLARWPLHGGGGIRHAGAGGAHPDLTGRFVTAR